MLVIKLVNNVGYKFGYQCWLPSWLIMLVIKLVNVMLVLKLVNNVGFKVG